MPNYQNIIKNSAVATIQTSDGPLNVCYYPGLITQKMALKLEEFSKRDTSATTKEQFRDMNTLIITLIKSWDLMDGEDMFPLDADSMMILPIELIKDIVGAMTSPN